MAAKIEVHRIMQMGKDLSSLRKIYQRFSELKTDSAEDHHLFREFERIYRNQERMLNTLMETEVTVKG